MSKTQQYLDRINSESAQIERVDQVAGWADRILAEIREDVQGQVEPEHFREKLRNFLSDLGGAVFQLSTQKADRVQAEALDRLSVLLQQASRTA